MNMKPSPNQIAAILISCLLICVIALACYSCSNQDEIIFDSRPMLNNAR